MKIKTQYLASVIIFGVVLIGVGVSVLWTYQRVAQIRGQEQIARRTEMEARDMGYLSSDFLLYKEAPQRARWEAAFNLFGTDLARLNASTAEQDALLRDMRSAQQRLKAVFDDVAARVQGDSAGTGSVDLSLIQTSWSRLQVQEQGIVFDASRLAQSFNSQAEALKQANLVLIFVLLGVFGIYFAAVYWLVSRRVLRSIAVLQSGAEIVGSGNLDHAVPEPRNDEVGELSRAFNRMAASLKATTASKTDLETEVVERKRVEAELRMRGIELETANRELEAFTYSVSHDLRAPLRSVAGFSQAVIEDYKDKLDDTGVDYLRRVSDSAELMGRLIDDLLSLSRLSRATVQAQRVDLSAMAHAVAGDLQVTEPGRHVEFMITPGLEDFGDPRLLRTVFDNLLGNAWKFSSKTEKAQIEFGVTESKGKKAYFVRDNGAGFDQAYAAKLFLPFQRLHTTAEFSGTGIGLASVQRIIRHHEGEIWAEGAVGHGAAFYFVLGLAHAPAQ